MDKMDGWIGVDLDGTLAVYTGWKGQEHIGQPVVKMIEHVKRLLSQGKTVKVFTARIADDPGAVKIIQKWLVDAGLPKLEVVNAKDNDMEYLIDDRVKQVIRNKGIFVKDFGVKAIMNFKGLPIMIENPVGSVRTGIDKAGEPWQTKFYYPYGYIAGTKGADKEGIDCFIGNNPTSDRVFIVHQTDGQKNFDEDKVMLGFDSKEQARDAYLAHMNTQFYIGTITEMPFYEFKAKLQTKGQRGEKLI